MLSIHYEGRAICGTYPYEEAEKKVADVLAFAGEHKHPLHASFPSFPRGCRSRPALRSRGFAVGLLVSRSFIADAMVTIG
jgi:hypothetical protein